MSKTSLKRIREIDALFEKELLKSMQTTEDVGGSNESTVEKNAKKMAKRIGATEGEFNDYVAIHSWIHKIVNETPDNLIETRLAANLEFWEKAAGCLGVFSDEFLQYMREEIKKFKEQLAKGKKHDWFGKRSDN